MVGQAKMLRRDGDDGRGGEQDDVPHTTTSNGAFKATPPQNTTIKLLW